MSWQIYLTALAIITGFFSPSIQIIAEEYKAYDYRVLANKDNGLTVQSVERLLNEGDKYFMKENYSLARKKFDKARELSMLLLGFYNDLSTSFKGLDARIPREMDSNSRKVLSLLTKANLRLVALFRKTDRTELAVPLLVEVVRISSPSNLDGQKAYKLLFELGFVNTPFSGAK